MRRGGGGYGVSEELFIRNLCIEGTFLQILFQYTFLINGIAWYVSAMVVCLPVILWGLYYARKFYLWVVAPYAALIIYSFFVNNWGHVDFGVVWLGNINGGLLRGFAALNLGLLCYIAYKNFAKHDFSMIHHHLLSCVELLIFGIVFIHSIGNRQTPFDFVEVVLLFFGIIVAFTEKGFLNQLLNNKAVLWLGSISYFIYLNQSVVNWFVAMQGIQSKALELIINIICQTISGSFTCLLINFCVPTAYKRIKTMLLSDNMRK